ncbi:hypothetical protein Ahy_B05g076933 [Arachis hypogaea]|uniref:Mannosyltransferase n=1 Tax=Arachis hypogaea TaxID=3818 RepID=A0A444Z4L8_ARAHY|nr:hypothetical protein Ahy_B05g076933 [Arachis hypogaea]
MDIARSGIHQQISLTPEMENEIKLHILTGYVCKNEQQAETQIKRRIGIGNHISERRLIDDLSRMGMNESIGFAYLLGGICASNMNRPVSYDQAIAWKLPSEAVAHDKDCTLANILASYFLHSSDPSKASLFLDSAKFNLDAGAQTYLLIRSYHVWNMDSSTNYYGTHKWHWYFTQGFPVMIFSFLPFCIDGIIYSKQWRYACLLAWVLGLYGVLGHKEFRFVLRVLPIAVILSGYFLAMIEDPSLPGYKAKEYLKKRTNCSLKMKGPEDVINHLAREASHGKVKNILFLTPCHATPYYSVLHRDLPMQFLDCTPSKERGVLNEPDHFLMDSVSFLSEYAKICLLSHIVLFDSEEQKLKNLLNSYDYREERRFFNAHFKVGRELQASIVVYIHTRQ